jgi:hypothetical protein
MPDLHRQNRATVRPPPEVKQAAQDALAGTGWTFNDFVVACLAMLVKRPKTFLKQLEPYKPESKRGRPRKQS